MRYTIKNTEGKIVKTFESDTELNEADVLRNYPVGYTVEIC